MFISSFPSHQHEDVDEQVDDVQEDGQGSEDVVLWVVGVLVLANHHQLGVIDQEKDHGEGTHRPVHHLHDIDSVVIRKQGDYEKGKAEEDKQNEKNKDATRTW